MDLNQIKSVYGTFKVERCHVCHGKGCDNCFNFGSFLVSEHGFKFTYKYPLFVNVKIREKNKVYRIIVLSATSLVFLITLAITYYVIFITF